MSPAGRIPLPISAVQRQALEELMSRTGRPGDPDGPAPALTLERVAEELNARRVPPRTEPWGRVFASQTALAYESVRDQMPEPLRDVVKRALADADAAERARTFPDGLGPDVPDPSVSWTASGVRSAVRALRRQRLDLLTRLASFLELLVNVRRVRPLGAADLIFAVRHARIDLWWVWDRYQNPEVRAALGSLDHQRDLAPPIVIDADGKVTLMSAGDRILKVHDGVAALPDQAIADVISQLHLASGQPVRYTTMKAICSFYGTTWLDVFEAGQAAGLLRPDTRPPAEHPLIASARDVVLTDRGARLARDYYAACVVSEGGDLLEAYHPLPIELTTLPYTWDWSDRPHI